MEVYSRSAGTKEMTVQVLDAATKMLERARAELVGSVGVPTGERVYLEDLVRSAERTLSMARQAPDAGGPMGYAGISTAKTVCGEVRAALARRGRSSSARGGSGAQRGAYSPDAAARARRLRLMRMELDIQASRLIAPDYSAAGRARRLEAMRRELGRVR